MKRGRMTVPRSLGTVLAAVTFGTLAYAQMHGGMSHGTPAQPGGMPGMAGMGGMNDMCGMGMSGLHGLTGKSFDRAFLTMMVPHHQAAVEMSRAALQTTRDPKVKGWAEAIIKAQNREITQMNEWLRAYGGPVPQLAAHMKGMMDPMLADLKQAPNRDRAFVQGMIPHHGSAVMMANMALMRGENPNVLRLAKDVVVSQAQEMAEFRAYLNTAK